VDEPRTHYQVSFTSRQGLAVFVGLVAAIVLAYFLGLMTGLAGSEARQSSGATVASSRPAATVTLSVVAEPAFPPPVLGVPGKTPAARPTAPPGFRAAETPAAAPTPSIQLFEDRASSEPTHPPARAAAVKPAAAQGKPPAKAAEPAGFWVQVDSLSSKEQAESRRRGLAAAGFKAAVVPGAGSRGPIFKVRVGPYATREEAERAREALVRKAKVANPWIVPPGQ
jgi:cell division protein FtsN